MGSRHRIGRVRFYVGDDYADDGRDDGQEAGEIKNIDDEREAGVRHHARRRVFRRFSGHVWSLPLRCLAAGYKQIWPRLIADWQYLNRQFSPKFPRADNEWREFRHSRACILAAAEGDVAGSVKLPAARLGLDAERASVVS